MGEGSRTEDDLSSLYEAMAKYDFNKPYTVSVEEYNDDNFNAVPEATCQGSRSSNSAESIFLGNENSNCNKENFNSNVEVTSPSANQNKVSLKSLQTPSSAPSWITELLYAKDSFTTYHSTNKQPTRRIPCRDINRYPHCDPGINRSHSLKKLSINLISCLRAYNYYSLLVRQYEINSRLRLDAKKQYQRTIYNYFQQSRNIAELEILPRSNDYNFIKDFLERTTEIAINEERFRCSYTDVQSIYNELMRWILYPHSCRYTQNSEPTYLQHKAHGGSGQGPPMQQVQGGTNDNNQREYPCPQTCLFRYGNPGFEVRLNVSTEILNNINKQRNVSGNNNSKIVNRNISHQVAPSDNLRDLPVGSSQPNAAPIKHLPTRSTSRDSGFMSPVNELLVDLENEDYNNQPHEAYGTSLASNVRHISRGPCELCNKYSTLKCVGCYNVFYCSETCQNLDWSRHRSYCKIGYYNNLS